MIEIKYLIDYDGADKYGTCAGCGKFSEDDPAMIRVRFEYNNIGHGSAICLCDKCRHELWTKI